MPKSGQNKCVWLAPSPDHFIPISSNSPNLGRLETWRLHALRNVADPVLTRASAYEKSYPAENSEVKLMTHISRWLRHVSTHLSFLATDYNSTAAGVLES